MTTLREAAQAVLDRWDSPKWEWHQGPTAEVMNDLRRALEQPEQEPVAWVNAKHLQGLTLGHYGHAEIYTDESQGRIPLYTHPPRREWRGLTDEEIEHIWEADDTSDEDCRSLYYAKKIGRAIEAKLKEKNT
jgi:hypothetical protein